MIIQWVIVGYCLLTYSADYFQTEYNHERDHGDEWLLELNLGYTQSSKKSLHIRQMSVLVRALHCINVSKTFQIIHIDMEIVEKGILKDTCNTYTWLQISVTFVIIIPSECSHGHNISDVRTVS